MRQVDPADGGGKAMCEATPAGRVESGTPTCSDELTSADRSPRVMTNNSRPPVVDDSGRWQRARHVR